MAVMKNDVDVPRVAVVGVCSVLLLYVLITLARVAFLHLAAQQERIKNYDVTPRALVQYRGEQATKLASIESAMAAVVRDEAHKQKLEGAPH